MTLGEPQQSPRLQPTTSSSHHLKPRTFHILGQGRGPHATNVLGGHLVRHPSDARLTRTRFKKPFRDDITLHELEVLLGKLLYSSKLATPARRFLNRALQLRWSFTRPGPLPVTPGFKEDISWFINFLPTYNGQALIRSRVQASQHLYTDASLGGGGAYLKNSSFLTVDWNKAMATWDIAINELELFTVLIALRTWASLLSGTTTQLWSDNEPSIICLRSGKTKNAFLASCLREIWHICASNDIDILASHIPCEQNQIAHFLSRKAISPRDRQRFQQFKRDTTLRQTHVPEDTLMLPDTALSR